MSVFSSYRSASTSSKETTEKRVSSSPTEKPKRERKRAGGNKRVDADAEDTCVENAEELVDA